MWSPWVGLVKRAEGLRLTVYQCPGKVWTIGYGHTGPDITKNTPAITEAVAAVWLERDLSEAMLQALHLSPGLVGESPARSAAVADFCFNCGPHNYETSRLRQAVDRKDWGEAARQNAKWVFSKGVKLGGLITRRAFTSEWLLHG